MTFIGSKKQDILGYCPFKSSETKITILYDRVNNLVIEEIKWYKQSFICTLQVSCPENICPLYSKAPDIENYTCTNSKTIDSKI